MSEMERYREVIRENIDYDLLLQEKPYDEDRLDEIVELLVETVCSNRKQIRVGGSDLDVYKRQARRRTNSMLPPSANNTYPNNSFSSAFACCVLPVLTLISSEVSFS